MKIKQLSIYGFSSHVNTALTFDRPVSMIVGPLNSGKSSIAQAIEFALIGECGYYRKRTDSRIDLIHDLTDMGAMTVTLDTDKGSIFRSRTVDNTETCEWNGRTKKSDEAEIEVINALGVSKTVLSAALNTSDFFNLEAAKQKELIIGLIGAEITDSKVRAAFEGEMSPLDMLKGSLNSLADLENAFQYAFSRRTIVKREQKELKPAAPPEGDRPPVDGIQQKLTTLDTELQEAIAAKARLEGAASTGSARSQAEARKAELQKVPKGAGDTEIKKLIAAASQAVKDMEHAKASAAGAVDAFTTLKTDIGIQESHAQKLSTFTGLCVFSDVDCAATPASIEAAKKEATKKLAYLKSLLVNVTKEMNELAAKRDNQEPLRKAEADLREAQQKTAAFESAQKQIAAIDAELMKLELVPADANKIQSMETAIQGLRSRIAKGRTLLAEAQSWIERDRQVRTAADRRKAVETELAALEQLCDFLGPKGIKVKLIDERIALFEQAINAHLSHFGFTLKIESEPWRIIAKGRPAGRLSASERFRLGTALQIGISKMTGLNFVICDGTEILPRADFSIMMGMLMSASLDGALVIRTLQTPLDQFKPAVHPGIEYFTVENVDGVSKVTKV